MMLYQMFLTLQTPTSCPPATIDAHPIGLLTIEDQVPPPIGREDLHPVVDPGVVDLDHLNGLLELDDPASRSVIDRVARAVGKGRGQNVLASASRCADQ